MFIILSTAFFGSYLKANDLGFYIGPDEIRCASLLYPKRIECDPSHLSSMGASTRKLFEVKGKDAQLLYRIAQKFRIPEVIGNGSTINYKMMSIQLSFMLQCFVKYPPGPDLATSCRLYYNPFKKDPDVDFLENDKYVNIILKNKNMYLKIKQFLDYKKMSIFVSHLKEKDGEYFRHQFALSCHQKRFCLQKNKCYEQACLIRGLTPKALNFEEEQNQIFF